MRSRLLAMLIGLAMLVGSCASVVPPVPETPRERLAAAEISFGFILDEVHNLVVMGFIEPASDEAKVIGQILMEIDTAMQAWRRSPDDVDVQAFVLLSIGRAQAWLIQIKSRDMDGKAGWPNVPGQFGGEGGWRVAA